MMKLSDYVIDFIAKQGVSHIFEFIGGAITHLLDSTYDRQDINCVSVHHEQAGAFAAEAYARINGKLGVAMATSGPGALNMVTGIGSCYFDSVPCLFITGQVNTYEYKFDRPVRQIGFQETDIVSVVKPLTKYAEMVIDAKKIRYCLEKAVYVAQNGRPGPVLLDIPMNIQRAQIEPESLESFFESKEYIQLAQENTESHDLDQVAALIRQAERPVILAGGGIRAGNAAGELNALVLETGIPVVVSLMGLDVISHDNPLFCGMIGSYGNRYSNLVLANCDLLLVLGSRLDTRQTGTRPDTFARAATKIHVDIDPVEPNAKVKTDIAISSDVKVFLTVLREKCSTLTELNFTQWYSTIDQYKEKFSRSYCTSEIGKIDPNGMMELLSNKCRIGDVICIDVGQHQMWAAQSFKLKRMQRMLNSGGMGAMGFALPAAIGAAKAQPGSSVVVIAGDGGIQLNIQELDLIVKHSLPVKIFVFNNGCLGMVRQFQDIYFNGRQQSTVVGYNCPEFTEVAKAYGMPSYTISSMIEADKIIDKAMQTKGPAFVNIILERETVVKPKLVVNRPIEDMAPHLDRAELKKLMIIDLAEEVGVPK